MKKNLRSSAGKVSNFLSNDDLTSTSRDSSALSRLLSGSFRRNDGFGSHFLIFEILGPELKSMPEPVEGRVLNPTNNSHPKQNHSLPNLKVNPACYQFLHPTKAVDLSFWSDQFRCRICLVLYRRRQNFC